MRISGLLVFVLVAGLVGPTESRAQSKSDRAAVRAAVLDYVEGFYEGDSTKLIRSVRPEVSKYGFSRRDTATTYRGMAMPWSGFLSYAQREKQSGAPRAKAPRNVELLDVLDQTAAAKLTAWWGIDYLLLAKYDGKWMVTHVLWQSPPPSKSAKTPRPNR